MAEDRWSASLGQQAQGQKNQSCFATLGRVFKNFNPCLRPQRQSQNLTKFLQQFNEVSLYEDPYFGEVFLLQSLTHHEQILLKKQKLYTSESTDRQQEIRQLESFKNNPHVVSQTLIEKINKAGFLWSKVQIYLAYDFIVFDLQKQFQYRIAKGSCFSDREITGIIKGACKGYIHLQSTDYSSIRMSYIYFTRKGMVKVAHPHLFHYKTNLQNICEHDQSKGIYLSPQEMHCLERGQKDAIMGWKSNSYVFGMLLLSLMSQSHLNQVYDYSACQIDKTKVQQLLRNCKQIYPEKTVSLVQKLIQQRPEDRLTFRNLLSKISYTAEVHQQIDLALINQKSKPVEILPNYGYEFASNLPSQPQHLNYLAGLVYPRIGRTGQFYNQNRLDNSNIVRSSLKRVDDINIVAQQRYYYENNRSSYIGDGKIGINPYNNQSKAIREGKGFYQNHDGQLYIGDWVKGQMHGYGKLYWKDKKIRYEGDFKNGKFNGRGTQYNGDPEIVGFANTEDAPDLTFVRLQRNNWLKYEGSFVNDKRQGQGIVYFKTGRWMGNFKDGQPNGHGLFIDNNGKQTRGCWRDSILQV